MSVYFDDIFIIKRHLKILKCFKIDLLFRYVLK